MFSDLFVFHKEPTKKLAGCVEVYDDVLLHPEYFISISEEIDRWRDAVIYDHDGDPHTINKDYRSNMILDINADAYSTHPAFTYMNDMVRSYIDNYSERYEVGYEYLEPTQLLKYSPGEFYKRHFDTGPAFPRVISALLYLNDVDDGGETYFTNFDVSVRPRAGRLVIFPSNYAYAHEARPPKDGYKYVFVFWTREWERHL